VSNFEGFIAECGIWNWYGMKQQKAILQNAE